MDIQAMSALSAYSYQTALAQTGSRNQAVAEALAANQAQVGQLRTLMSSTGTPDPYASLAGASGLQALTTLSYNSALASGNGSAAVQSLLASLNPSPSSLLPSTSNMPQSALLLSSSTTTALARYAYDQSQNPAAAASQALAAGQQSLLASGWNLLV